MAKLEGADGVDTGKLAVNDVLVAMEGEIYLLAFPFNLPPHTHTNRYPLRTHAPSSTNTATRCAAISTDNVGPKNTVGYVSGMPCMCDAC